MFNLRVRMSAISLLTAPLLSGGGDGGEELDSVCRNGDWRNMLVSRTGAEGVLGSLAPTPPHTERVDPWTKCSLCFCLTL